MNAIVRQYNYKLETGVVGTDDENIANVLYSINQMEKNVSFTSSDEEELVDALDELFFMVTDVKVHMSRFLKEFVGKTDASIGEAIISVLDEAMDVVDNAMDQTDMAEMCAVFPRVYKKLLDIVPSVLVLDAQASGRE